MHSAVLTSYKSSSLSVLKFLFSIYGPSTKRSGHRKKKKKTKQNKTKQEQKKNAWSVIYSTDKENKADKMFTLRLPMHLGDRKGPETTAGHVAGLPIWQSFDRLSKKKVLLAHENINTQKRLSEKLEKRGPFWKKLIRSKLRTLLEYLGNWTLCLS